MTAYGRVMFKFFSKRRRGVYYGKRGLFMQNETHASLP